MSEEETLLPKLKHDDTEESYADIMDMNVNLSNEEDIEEHDLESEKNEVVEKLLSTLDLRERQIMQCCFGLGNKKQMTLKECGLLLGLSQERVRQIKEKTLLKLKSEALILAQ